MGLNNRTTTGFTSSTPNIVPVQLTVFTHSYTVFIGGASDKYSFAPGDLPINISNQSLGPTQLVGRYVKIFKAKKGPKFINCTIRYYGYEEAFTGMTDSKRKNKLNAYKDIVEYINKHPNTQVNIIGHSLGGWNAAGLAEELSKNRICKVNLLITVDPVGIYLSYSALTPIRAQIYFRQPSPVTNYWVNLSCQPEHYDSNDRIADSGGRWIDGPKAKASIFYKTTFSHADFEEIMKEKIIMNKSPEDMLCVELEKVK